MWEIISKGFDANISKGNNTGKAKNINIELDYIPLIISWSHGFVLWSRTANIHDSFLGLDFCFCNHFSLTLLLNTPFLTLFFSTYIAPLTFCVKRFLLHWLRGTTTLTQDMWMCFHILVLQWPDMHRDLVQYTLLTFFLEDCVVKRSNL